MFIDSTNLTNILTDKVLMNDNSLAKLLFELHTTNLRQWNMENVFRKKGLSDIERINAKEEIDNLNMQRVSIIEQIDEYIFHGIEQNFDSIPHTETPGTVYDRVIISLIKRKAIWDYENKYGTSTKNIKYEFFSKQVDYLMSSMDNYFELLKRGKMHFQLFKQMKIYE